MSDTATGWPMRSAASEALRSSISAERLAVEGEQRIAQCDTGSVGWALRHGRDDDEAVGAA